MTSVRSSLAYSFLGANTVTVLQFASTLIIARLLTPEELGIYSIAAVFIGLANVLRDFGVSNYLIQVEKLTNEIIRTAYGLVIIAAVLLGMIILLSADAIATFYGDERVGDVLVILAINFFITPLGSITLTIARRDMRFRALAIIRVLSAIVAIGTSISLIVAGLGPAGLAWGAVAATTVTFLLSIRLRPSDMPLLPALRNAKEIASFGAISTLSNILGELNANASDMLLGKLLSLESVGFFNRAISLTQFVSRALGNALNPVLLPWLSELKRDNQHPRTAYAKVVELTTGVTWPIYVFAAVFSDEIVLLLFGDQWGQSAELVPYFCAAAGITSIYNVCSPLYHAAGRPSAWLIAQGVNLPIKVASIILLAPFGLIAIAIAWPLLTCVSGLTHQVLMKRLAGIAFTDTSNAIKKSFVLGLSTLAVAQLAETLLPSVLGQHLTMFVAALLVAAAYLGTALAIKHPIFSEMKLILSKLRSRRS